MTLTSGIPPDQLRVALDSYARHGTISGAAKELNLSRSTLRRWLYKAEAEGISPVEGTKLPGFPADDLSIEKIIEQMDARFVQREQHHKAKRWAPIEMATDEPIAISFFGDPHLDDDGCNWPMLRAHCDIHRTTPGFYGVNIGDTTNNWTGRLMRLFANQETSQKTARKLAKWFLADSGVKWLVWLLGNHDVWNDGEAIMQGLGAHLVWMEDWQAQFRLTFPNQRECRIWAAHNFFGKSIWNSLHGMQRAAHTKVEAHIYVGGHLHNWAIHQEESASRDFTYWLARARGYKYLDSHAVHHGHQSQDDGAAITAVINPAAKTESAFVQCFADMEVARIYLNSLRKKK